VYFGPNHPMKPHRLCMTHHLVLSYDLHKKMEIYVGIEFCLFPFFMLTKCLNVSLTLFCSQWILQRPHKAYPTELAQFHSADYVEFLHRITPDTQHLYASELTRCMDADIFLFYRLLLFQALLFSQ
jgi:histone deacetylase 1/2